MGSMPVSNPMDDGYPMSNTNDGLDTKKIANREGFNKQLGTRLNSVRTWTNSKTGKTCDAPDWARDDD